MSKYSARPAGVDRGPAGALNPAMKDPGELICMVLAGGFVLLVINAKAERAGGWGNYLGGCLVAVGAMFVLGLIIRACKAIT